VEAIRRRSLLAGGKIMNAIKLSICIPTYNREAHLRKALSYCEAHYDFEFPYEIVISDNASTDDTSGVVGDFIAKGLPIRYHRRAVNGGAGPNLTCAFHHAVGTYSIYLADDDLLIPDGVKAAVAYLDAHPDVTVCHAPWYLHDEVAKKDISQFYAVDADRKFSQGSFAEVFQFIYERHIFPEIGIYRASALRSAWVPRDFCFWAFTNLAHFLDLGAVAFLKRPFYRSVVVSEIGQGRQQLGFEEVMVAWDKYRGGLEYFLYTGVRRGKIRNTRRNARSSRSTACPSPCGSGWPERTTSRPTRSIRGWRSAAWASIPKSSSCATCFRSPSPFRRLPITSTPRRASTG
jgi:glycosyltransferase involved in cell wall biosynthesis